MLPTGNGLAILSCLDCRTGFLQYCTVGFSRIPVFLLLLLLLLYFFVAAAAFLGIGFWLIRGIGFRGILGFLGF